MPFWGAKHDFSRRGVTNPFLGPGTSLQLVKKNLRIFQDFGGFLQKTKNCGKTLAQCWLMIIRKPIDAFNGSNRSLGPQVGLAMCQNLPQFDLQGQIFLKPKFRFFAKKLGQLWRQKSAKKWKNPPTAVKRQIIGSAMGFPPIGGWGLSANCGTRYAPKTAPGWKKGEILKIFNCGFYPVRLGGLQLLL